MGEQNEHVHGNRSLTGKLRIGTAFSSRDLDEDGSYMTAGHRHSVVKGTVINVGKVGMQYHVGGFFGEQHHTIRVMSITVRTFTA